MRKSILIAAIAGLALCLSGCKTLTLGTAGAVASAAQSLSTASAGQATTLSEGEQFATLVIQAVDTYVNAGNPSKAELQKIQALSAALHSALVNWENANSAGQSLAKASFNSALKAFNAYSATIVSPTVAASSAASN